MSQGSSVSPHIGVLHLYLSFPYWATFAQGVSNAAVDMGVELCLPFTEPEDNIEIATTELIGQRPAAVIVPYPAAWVFPTVMQRLVVAGIPLIGAEFPLEAPYTAGVRADESVAMREIIRFVIDRIGGQGRVINIHGINQTIRQAVLYEVLKEYPQVELAFEHEGDWTRDSGRAGMLAALEQVGEVDAVFGLNDHMALGAADVLAERGLQDKIVVVGYDADPEGILAVRRGTLAATAYRGIYHVGRAALEMAVQVARGQQKGQERLLPTMLITRENLAEAMIDTVELLPGLLRDLVDTTKSQRRLQQETIDAQRALIYELSTPIIPISEHISIMPLIGALDSQRALRVLEVMLHAVSEHSTQFMIIDITGIDVVDTQVAAHLIQAAQAIKLLGAQVVLVGISPEIAQTLVGLGVSFQGIVTRATLQDGFAYARNRLKRG